jgi:hypothetical protein
MNICEQLSYYQLLYRDQNSTTYNCCGHNDGREEDSFENAKCLLQMFRVHVAAGFNDVIPKRHNKISLLGSLKGREHLTL